MCNILRPNPILRVWNRFAYQYLAVRRQSARRRRRPRTYGYLSGPFHRPRTTRLLRYFIYIFDIITISLENYCNNCSITSMTIVVRRILFQVAAYIFTRPDLCTLGVSSVDGKRLKLHSIHLLLKFKNICVMFYTLKFNFYYLS